MRDTERSAATIALQEATEKELREVHKYTPQFNWGPVELATFAMEALLNPNGVLTPEARLYLWDKLQTSDGWVLGGFGGAFTALREIVRVEPRVGKAGASLTLQELQQLEVRGRLNLTEEGLRSAYEKYKAPTKKGSRFHLPQFKNPFR
jgi:hypothetical protein